MAAGASAYDPLLAHLAELGISTDSAWAAIELAGCRTADHVLEVLAAEKASSAQWQTLYSTLYNGRPYYHDKRGGNTTWDEPVLHRLAQGRLDASQFSLPVQTVGALLRALGRLQSSATADWAAARDTLAKLLGNVWASPLEAKFRRLNPSNEKLNASLLRHPGALDCLLACGWTRQADALLLPDSVPLDALRCLLARLTEAQQLTDDTGGAAGSSAGGGVSLQPQDDPAEYEAMRRWQKGGIHRCGACSRLINDGSERAWTGRWDAPQGQYRYACSAGCGISLCEKCFDEKKRPGKGCGGGAEHCYTPHVPITSRLQASGATGGGAESDANPWGRFGASVSSRSRERLKDRTGL